MERVVHTSEKGMRLDRFLRIHCPELPHGAAIGLLRSGRLSVDGRPFRLADGLTPGQRVRIADAAPARAAAKPGAKPAPAPDPDRVAAARARLDAITLHADADLIVFDKPSGLPVHPGSRTSDNLDDLLALLVDEGGERPRLVHRLDRETSGVILAARTRAVAAKLGRAFETRAVAKTYLAVVEGVPEGTEGRISLALAPRETAKGGRMVVVAADAPDASPAETEWRLLASAADRGSALLELHPATGRRHQLRAHLAAIGHPILGDGLYGRRGAASRLMLHARRLVVPTPRGGRLEVAAPVPEAFLTLFPAAGGT
jgi:23S rRNA pseudouridine955/2504/2580 synthase